MANDFATVDDADLPTYELVSPTATQNWLGNSGTVRGIRVLDFGQGDCNAVVAQDGKPVLYFDMGGGKHTGSRTHPWHKAWEEDFDASPFRTKMLNLDYQPTVILSHWDGDHYSTARYVTHPDRTHTKTVPPHHPGVKDLQWLVPRQNKHPSKLDFVLDLTNVRCWPDGVPKHTFRLTDDTQVVVEKCLGEAGQYDPNLDGLAVTLERVDPDNQHAVIERIVMPGDAPFKYIPSCADGPPDKVVGLLAFHHGSDTHLDDDTIAAIPQGPADGSGVIAFTFGLKPGGGRCYGHPRATAINQYNTKGWLLANRRTPAGTFGQWPPPDADLLGDPANRGDIDIDLPTLARARPQVRVAMRRLKRKRDE